MATAKAAVPKPRIVSQVCSVCGLDWDEHGESPTTETCVKLLLDEVSELNRELTRRPKIWNNPYPVIYPARPYWPQWYYNGQTFGHTGSQIISGSNTLYSPSSITSQVTNNSLSPGAVPTAVKIT